MYLLWYYMMDILNHPLTVFGNIENTLWFSEPFSCGAGYGNFGSGWFFLKGIQDLEAVGVRNGWQSNLRLFFLVRLARACKGGGVHAAKRYERNVFECNSNNKINVDQSCWERLCRHFGQKIVYHLLSNGWYFYIMYAAEDSVLINCLIIQDYEIIMNLFKIKNRWENYLVIDLMHMFFETVFLQNVHKPLRIDK